MDNKFKWLEEYQEDSWDRAIRFGEQIRSKKLDTVEATNEAVCIENIIDAFLLKIFGTENDDAITEISKEIDSKLIPLLSK